MTKSKVKDFLKDLYKDPKNRPANAIKKSRRVSTISPSLDWALNGGLVPGRFYGLMGPPGGGKSMLTANLVYHLLVDNPNSIAVWIDTEFSYDDHWVRDFFASKGEDIQERLLVRQVQSPTDIFDYFNKDLMRKVDDGMEICACVVDSLQQIRGPKEENKAKTTDAVMGDLSGYLPGAIRSIIEESRAKDIAWFFILQIRQSFENAGQKYVSKEDKYSVSGGNAFKHSLDVLLLLEAAKGKKNALYSSEIKNIDDTELKVGHLIRAMVLKNRMGPSFTKAEFYFEYAKGISQVGIELGRLSLTLGVVKLEGRSYLLDGERIANSEKNFFDEIEKNEMLRNKLLEKINNMVVDSSKVVEKNDDGIILEGLEEESVSLEAFETNEK